jgi:hypothetical protein
VLPSGCRGQHLCVRGERSKEHGSRASCELRVASELSGEVQELRERLARRAFVERDIVQGAIQSTRECERVQEIGWLGLPQMSSAPPPLPASAPRWGKRRGRG